MGLAEWEDFFASAGIPETHCGSYAEVFDDNRITFDMLEDMSREYLTVGEQRTCRAADSTPLAVAAAAAPAGGESGRGRADRCSRLPG